ncbi:unnamed protein product [Didymodactylos carnosus]|uniref:Uncharacterized protein n=1 Tax=Didymodactylos carnosus TaxID=1234261 RepID=A0A814H4B5_9BILA|nr:unnamed protein product [Didymodactylos carnosus]CAF1004859.1 unnamed protein product [Didymodactylos carnosus]CAF3530325.1 unnamed protein product [Didymodactylos carnosus]CAF3776213.1 unnamed protein product [Didymodactylos carnosus]
MNNDTINNLSSSNNRSLSNRYYPLQNFSSSHNQFGTIGSQLTSVLNLPRQQQQQKSIVLPIHKSVYHSNNSSKCLSPVHCPQQHQKVQDAVESPTTKHSSVPTSQNPSFECVWNWILFSPAYYPQYYSPHQCKPNDSSSITYSNTEENDLISWLLNSDEDISSSTDITDTPSDDESSTSELIARHRCTSPTRSDSDDGYISSSDQGSNSLIYSSCELIKDEEKSLKINQSNVVSSQEPLLLTPLKKAPLSYAATVSSSKPNVILNKFATSPKKPTVTETADNILALRSPTPTTSLQKPKLFFVAPRFERLYQQKERTNNTPSSSANNKTRTYNQQTVTTTTTVHSNHSLTITKRR